MPPVATQPDQQQDLISGNLSSLTEDKPKPDLVSGNLSTMQDAPAKQDAPKNPYQSQDFTGYGPLEGTRWIKDQVQREFASMSLASDNPGLYVRQKFDIDKKIDGFGQNLTLEDAGHVFENVFKPSFDQLKIKSVQDDYDVRGKALLDQIYAPLGHGTTKPTWDQIPKNERIAAAAYAAVAALTGHGDRALAALARPLTMQEQENVKKEQEKQQNEELRRQGLVEQFKVLMGDKSAAVAAMETRQRQDAIDRRAETKQDFEERKQQDVNAKNAQTELDKFKDSDTGAKKAALTSYEQRMREIKNDPNFQASKEQVDWANTPSSQEKNRNALIEGHQQRVKQMKAEAAPKLAILNQRLTDMKKAGLIDDQRLSDMQYKAKNITPYVAKEDQDRVQKTLLEIDRLQFSKLHGWAKSAKDSVLLRDASGNLILGPGGQPIKTLGEARALVSNAEKIAKDQASQFDQEAVANGGSIEDAQGLRVRIRAMLESGNSPAEIEKGMGAWPFADKDEIARAVAIEKMFSDNARLRTKLGEARSEAAPSQSAAGVGEVKPEHKSSFDDLTKQLSGKYGTDPDKWPENIKRGYNAARHAAAGG